jgi:1-acyl-sn-glycerol-3-phosphate acyltransferase
MRVPPAQTWATASRDQGFAEPQRRVDREFDAPVFQRDPAFIEEQLPKIGRAIDTYFTPEVRGIERLPEEGPFLLVSNHSGGMMMPDAWALSSALLGRFGADRPIYPLLFDFVFKIPGLGDTFRRLGAIPASMNNAESALDLDAGVMVYPGGDWEAYRPWTDRNRIDFHDRTGFVKLALRRGVPVFPAVSHGSHHSVIVLSRGDRIARTLGLKRLRVGVFPFALGLPFGLLPLAPTVPIPSKILIEVLDPVDWSVHPPEAAEDPDTVQSCYDQITSSMQAALDRLVDEMPHPRVTRLRVAAGLHDRQ